MNEPYATSAYDPRGDGHDGADFAAIVIAGNLAAIAERLERLVAAVEGMPKPGDYARAIMEESLISHSVWWDAPPGIEGATLEEDK